MTYNIIYQDFSAYFSIQPYKTGWIYCLNESLYAPSLFAAPLSDSFGVFPFPSQSCTQKSFNHLMMLQFHQSETSWNKKYSYTYISFIPFTFVGWTSLNVLARKVFTILAESISQTMCPFSKFELHIFPLKTSGCDPPERGLESLPQAAPWCMVIGDFGMLLWWLLAGWQGSPTPGRFKPVGLKHWKRSKVW